MKRTRTLAVSLLALSTISGACGSDSGSASAGTDVSTPNDSGVTTTTDATDPDDRPIRVMITNDDGVKAPGLDTLVEYFKDQEGIEIHVVAPLENKSGTGESKTAATLVAEDSTTLSGFPAKAVRGTPSDNIVWAIDQKGLGFTPDLVFAGLNKGQNIGNLSQISGTVGVAKTAAQRGIPAVAMSQGALGDVENPNYKAGLFFAVAWMNDHREALTIGSEPAGVTSINVPTCVTGTIRGMVEVPNSPDLAGRNAFDVNCESTLENPKDDVDAVTNGFVAISEIDFD